MRTTLCGLVLLTGMGCANVQPIGPFAKYMGKKPDTKAVLPGSEPPPPSTAGRPTPPAVLITPGEVSADNPGVAAQQLGRELEYDRNTMKAMPIVSVIKGADKGP